MGNSGVKAAPTDGSAMDSLLRGGEFGGHQSGAVASNRTGCANGTAPEVALNGTAALNGRMNLPHVSDVDKPTFPLGVSTVRGLLPQFAFVALGGITTLNIYAASMVASVPKAGFVSTMIFMCPFSFIPFGVLGAVLACAASKSARLVGVSCGFFLGEVLYTVALGAFVTIIKSEGKLVVTHDKCWSSGLKKDCDSVWVVIVAVFLWLLILVVWSYVLPLPKLRFWHTSRIDSATELTQAASTRAAEAAAAAAEALREAEAAAKSAQEDALAAKLAADAAKAAGQSSSEAASAEKAASSASSASKQAAMGASLSAISAAEGASDAREFAKETIRQKRLAETYFEWATKFEEESRGASDRTAVLLDGQNSV